MLVTNRAKEFFLNVQFTRAMVSSSLVHLGGGIWGVISGPIFHFDTGVFYAGDLHSFRLFGWNVVGVLVIMAWSAVMAIILFGSMRLAGVLRVSEELERKGTAPCSSRQDVLGGGGGGYVQCTCFCEVEV